uniref:Uncharacterized protein n=1 Tax=Micrurus lemniscatus lemniscatus TaxID=129467 RepID=A0A2D4I4W3_MICLE
MFKISHPVLFLYVSYLNETFVTCSATIAYISKYITTVFSHPSCHLTSQPMATEIQLVFVTSWLFYIKMLKREVSHRIQTLLNAYVLVFVKFICSLSHCGAKKQKWHYFVFQCGMKPVLFRGQDKVLNRMLST